MATALPVSSASNGAATNGAVSESKHANGEIPSFTVKTGLARMLKGGVIMDVVNAEQVQ
jgi:pyridoxal 5'-phosphate synthase pdxS subunit